MRALLTSDVNVPPDYFDKDYFLTGNKGHYGHGKWAPYTHPVYLIQNRKLAAILKYVFHPKTVLVLGCATGHLIQAFRERGVKAWGIDLSFWAIKNANLTVRDWLVRGDCCDLSQWKDNEFDLVVGWNVLEHIPMPQLLDAIKEAARVSKDSIAINIATTDDGVDKSHVSIFPAEWWQQQFGLFGFKLAWKKIHTYEWECNTASMFFVRPQPVKNVGN